MVPGRGELSTVFDPEKLNRFFSFALPLESVRLVVWELDTVTPYILERLGQLPRLHWLCFHEGGENDSHIQLEKSGADQMFSIWGPRDPGGKYDFAAEMTGIINKGIGI